MIAVLRAFAWIEFHRILGRRVRATRFWLGDGEVYDVLGGYERWRHEWGIALRARTFIEVVCIADRKTRWFNACQIVLIGNDPDFER